MADGACALLEPTRAAPSCAALARDPFYRAAWEIWPSKAIVAEAGFFDDGLAEPALTHAWSAPEWFTTSVEKVARHLTRSDAAATPRVVLLSTGAFAPLHDGHLAMLAAAKVALEAQGICVVGGYLSPSHDAYVATKYAGAAAMPAAERLQLCELVTRDSDWLEVDPWEAYYAPRPLNFTDVIRRLERYLAARFPGTPLEVVYVFGGDNAGFARAFVARGRAVCVGRPGYEEQVAAVKNDPHVAANGNILFVPAPAAEDVSSRAVRAGALQHLPEAIRGVYRSPERTASEADEQHRVYLVRDDGARATAHWAQGREMKLSAALAEFRGEVMFLLQAAFAEHAPADWARSMRVVRLDPDRQARAAVRAVSGARVLSLDLYVRGARNLDLSRVFALSGPQWDAEGVVARPGFPSLAVQVAAIEPGAYTLVEDDTASGRTLRALKALLPPGARIEHEVFLSRFRDASEADAPFWDVVDLRDFLVGAAHGGIVARLATGEIVRAPYMLPYVSLRSRAKLPLAAERVAARALWAANMRFFAAVPGIRVGDTDLAFQLLARSLGFKPETAMHELCAWHLDRLPGAVS